MLAPHLCEPPPNLFFPAIGTPPTDKFLLDPSPPSQVQPPRPPLTSSSPPPRHQKPQLLLRALLSHLLSGSSKTARDTLILDQWPSVHSRVNNTPLRSGVNQKKSPLISFSKHHRHHGQVSSISISILSARQEHVGDDLNLPWDSSYDVCRCLQMSADVVLGDKMIAQKLMFVCNAASPSKRSAS